VKYWARPQPLDGLDSTQASAKLPVAAPNNEYRGKVPVSFSWKYANKNDCLASYFSRRLSIGDWPGRNSFPTIVFQKCSTDVVAGCFNTDKQQGWQMPLARCLPQVTTVRAM
jgi:hypothetical protein